MPCRSGSKAKAIRHSPSASVNRSSFMFACFDPFSVSQCGRRSCGPNCRSKPTSAAISSCTARSKVAASAAKAGSNRTSPVIPAGFPSLPRLILAPLAMLSGEYALKRISSGMGQAETASRVVIGDAE
jgi:hypothetical protein